MLRSITSTLALAILPLVTLLCAPAQAQAQNQGTVYHLHPGDTVMISVWREDTLQKEVVVLPDGSITFPLAGRVEVNGLDTSAVEKLIAERIKEYIPDPVVTVAISQAGGSRVFVVGKVMKPGPVSLDTPKTAMQALGEAGGLDKFADDDGIKVLRKTSKGQELLEVHYDDLLKGRDLQSDIPLQAGDTILVP